MYSPSHFVETRLPVLHELIAAHRLATLVNVGAEGLTANHIPLLFDPARNVLCGHVARANPLWQAAAGHAVMAIFQGPAAYISPGWYPGKQVHGKVVPTWNYAVVHAHGTLRAISDADWLQAHISAMSDTNEVNQAQPWKVSDAPADFIDNLVGNIVGIEIDVSRLEGKWKMSQNRPATDRLSVATALDASGNSAAAALVRIK